MALALRLPIFVGTGFLFWTLLSIVAPCQLPSQRQLLAVQPKETTNGTLEAALHAPVNSTGAEAAHLRATEDQQRFCRSHPIKHPPTAFLNIPWQTDKNSSGGTLFKLMPSLRSSILGSESLIVSEPYHMYVYAKADIVSDQIAASGSWEADMTAQMVHKLALFAQAKGLARDEVYMIDIGANVGAHTLAMAAHGFNVLAFEPLHANIQGLRYSLCLNPQLQGRITLLQKGLGNANVNCTIYSPSDNMGDGVVACNGGDEPTSIPSTWVARGQLDVAKLDDLTQPALVEKYKGRVGVLKIDVEGNEHAVLEGALNFFRAVRPPYVTAECSDLMMIRASNKPASEFFRVMHDLGYEVRQDSFDGPVIPVAWFDSWQEPSIRNYWFTLSDTAATAARAQTAAGIFSNTGPGALTEPTASWTSQQ